MLGTPEDQCPRGPHVETRLTGAVETGKPWEAPFVSTQPGFSLGSVGSLNSDPTHVFRSRKRSRSWCVDAHPNSSSCMLFHSACLNKYVGTWNHYKEHPQIFRISGRLVTPPPKRFKWKKTVKNPVSRVNVSSMAIQLTLDTVSDFGHSPPPPHCSDF